MASVFKLGRDRKKRNAPWYFEFRDQNGKRRMRKGFTDKALTEQLAVKLETESRLRRMGYIDLEQEKQAEWRRSGLQENLEAFRGSLQAKKTTAKHLRLTIARVKRIIEACEFKTLGDLDAGSVEVFMTELREEEDLGHRTYNHYLQAIDSFCNWLVTRRRLDRNPLAGIPRLNTETDVRHPRRSLTPEELGKLLQAARESEVSVQCYTGEDRARIYMLSYMTGLRKGELASLTPSSFLLDASQPTVTVQAGASKHRRKDVLPLHPDLVPMVRDWIADKAADQPLFPRLARRKTWLMVKKDLERAGIPYRTNAGIADFHAAGRHTHITELLRTGAKLAEAKELARHGDIRMTMRYSHIGIEDQAKALAALRVPPCQDIVRKLCVLGRPDMSSAGTPERDGAAGKHNASRYDEASCDSLRQKKAPPVTGGAQWRRRESNPRPATYPGKLLRV
jgi:site-specific recombinase XerC